MVKNGPSYSFQRISAAAWRLGVGFTGLDGVIVRSGDIAGRCAGGLGPLAGGPRRRGQHQRRQKQARCEPARVVSLQEKRYGAIYSTLPQHNGSVMTRPFWFGRVQPKCNGRNRRLAPSIKALPQPVDREATGGDIPRSEGDSETALECQRDRPYENGHSERGYRPSKHCPLTFLIFVRATQASHVVHAVKHSKPAGLMSLRCTLTWRRNTHQNLPFQQEKRTLPKTVREPRVPYCSQLIQIRELCMRHQWL